MHASDRRKGDNRLSPKSEKVGAQEKGEKKREVEKYALEHGQKQCGKHDRSGPRQEDHHRKHRERGGSLVDGNTSRQLEALLASPEPSAADPRKSK